MVLRRVWNYIFQIYEARLRPQIQVYWQRVKPYYDGIKPILLHAFVAFTVASFCLYISAFLFGVVYYYNMPTTYHSFDVHFQYNRPCVEMHRHSRQPTSSDCGYRMLEESCYPTAKIILDDPSKKVVDPGQPYRAYLTLEVPESPTNLGIGMFMVTMKYGETQTSYPTSLRYRPLVFQFGYMLTFWPLYLFDFWEAKQVLTVPLFERVFFAHQTPKQTTAQETLNGPRRYTHFKPSKQEPHSKKSKPAENIQRYIEIQIDYPDIEIYSARLHLTATFSGLQYLLFQWPVFSFLIGTAIFFVPVLSCLLVMLYLAFVFGVNGSATARVTREAEATGSNTGRDAGNDDAVSSGGADNAGGDSEDPSSTVSSASSSIEMIGSPSVENISMDKALENDDPPKKEDESMGETPTTSAGNVDTLRKRK